MEFTSRNLQERYFYDFLLSSSFNKTNVTLSTQWNNYSKSILILATISLIDIQSIGSDGEFAKGKKSFTTNLQLIALRDKVSLYF